jgi:hypothetical protein
LSGAARGWLAPAEYSADPFQGAAKPALPARRSAGHCADCGAFGPAIRLAWQQPRDNRSDLRHLDLRLAGGGSLEKDVVAIAVAGEATFGDAELLLQNLRDELPHAWRNPLPIPAQQGLRVGQVDDLAAAAAAPRRFCASFELGERQLDAAPSGLRGRRGTCRWRARLVRGAKKSG